MRAGDTSALWHLALAFVDVALHRRGPEDIPASQFLFGLTLLCYVLVTLLSPTLIDSIDLAVGLAAYDTVLYLGFVWLVLNAFGRARRFWQTTTTMLGAETFLTLVRMPVLLWIDPNSSADGPGALATGLYLVLLLWTVDVAGFILSRAIQRAYVVGVLFVIGYIVGSWTLREFLFPVAG